MASGFIKHDTLKYLILRIVDVYFIIQNSRIDLFQLHLFEFLSNLVSLEVNVIIDGTTSRWGMY